MQNGSRNEEQIANPLEPLIDATVDDEVDDDCHNDDEFDIEETDSIEFHERFREPQPHYKARNNCMSVLRLSGSQPTRSLLRTADYPTRFRDFFGEHDVYRTTAIVTEQNGSKDSIKLIPAAWVEIDAKNVPEFWQRTRDDQRRLILDRAREHNLPRPSWINFSGGGFHLYWLFSSPVTPDLKGQNGQKKGIQLVESINKALIEVFRDFGADAGCYDAGRLMRVPGSINSRNGQRCYICFRNDDANGNVRTVHPRDLQRRLGRLISPFTDADRKEFRRRDAARSSAAQYHYDMMMRRLRGRRRKHALERPAAGDLDARIRHTFYSGVLKDIENLKIHRYGHGKIPEGQRDWFVFLYGCALAHVVSSDAWFETLKSCVENWVDPVFWKSCVNVGGNSFEGSLLKTLKDRIDLDAAGETTTNPQTGKVQTPIYSYSRAGFQQALAITNKEQSDGVVYMLADERVRNRTRKQKQRRRVASGRDKRATYEFRARALDLAAVALKDGLNWTYAAIAEKLDLTKNQIRGRLSNGRKRSDAPEAIERVQRHGESAVDALLSEKPGPAQKQPEKNAEPARKPESDASKPATSAASMQTPANDPVPVIDPQTGQKRPASVAQALDWIYDWEEATELCATIAFLRSVHWPDDLLKRTFKTDQKTLDAAIEAIQTVRADPQDSRHESAVRAEIPAYVAAKDGGPPDILGRFYDPELHSDINLLRPAMAA